MATREEQIAEVERRLDNSNPADALPIPVDFDPSEPARNLSNVSADNIGRLWAWDSAEKLLRMVYDPRD